MLRWLAASSALLTIALLPGELPRTVGQKNGSLVSESSTIYSLSCPDDLYAHNVRLYTVFLDQKGLQVQSCSSATQRSR